MRKLNKAFMNSRTIEDLSIAYCLNVTALARTGI